MAVEKLKMMNVVGPLPVMDEVITKLLKTKAVQFIPAQQELDHNAFTFSLEKEENVEKTLELNTLSAFEDDEEKKVVAREAKELMEFFGIEEVEEEYFKEVNVTDFHAFSDEIHHMISRLEEIEEEETKTKNRVKSYELFENVDIDLAQIQHLDYFDVRFGTLDSDGRYRLKRNYGNLLAMIYHTATMGGKEVYLAIYPKEVSQEMDRILRSLNWKDVDILCDYGGTATEILEYFTEKEAELRAERKEIEDKRQELLTHHLEEVKTNIGSMLLFEKLEDVKKWMIKSPKFFYLSGWVGVSDVEHLKSILSHYKDLTVDFHDPEDYHGKPPTKLKNAKFFRPFEMLLRMYGTPDYDELDPTLFFGLTYMVLFGAMFGDVGQGLIFLLGGFYLAKVKKLPFGALITRMGISSVVFGFLYGSFFGNENILPTIWMKPFDSINQALICAIGFGVLLLVVSYCMGFINKFRKHEVEEGLFGKEGVAGFLVYLMMLNLGLAVFGKNILSTKISVAVIVLAFLAMIFSQPIAQVLEGKKVNYYGDKSGYYVEGLFSLLEAILSTLSNIISFIRVGAFAINHVGLYLAFVTVGKMMGNAPGNIAMLVLGNVVIICLEGLIVFIQSLRLEYYEMFSKYYSGGGYEFVADRIMNSN